MVSSESDARIVPHGGTGPSEVSPRIAVVDYRKGNLKSVERGLRSAGGNAFVTEDAREFSRADALVLPGVGAFADAAATMQRLGQMTAIRECIDAGVLFLGICLGFHLMFDEGTEGTDFDDESTDNAHGLAVLPGVVSAMPHNDATGVAYKVPHVGWNAVEFDDDDPVPLFTGIPAGSYFYFTHSYIAPESPCTVAETIHSVRFPSAVAFRQNAFGVQFHPEKSSDAGALLLRNFVALATRGREAGVYEGSSAAAVPLEYRFPTTPVKGV